MASMFTSDTRHTYVQSTLCAECALRRVHNQHRKKLWVHIRSVSSLAPLQVTARRAGREESGNVLRSKHCNVGPRGYLLPAGLHKQSSNQSIQILGQCLDGNYKIFLMIFSLPEMCNCRSVQLSRDGRLTVTCILRFYSLFLLQAPEHFPPKIQT